MISRISLLVPQGVTLSNACNEPQMSYDAELAIILSVSPATITRTPHLGFMLTAREAMVGEH